MAEPSPLEFDLLPEEQEVFLADVNECLQAMETGILNLEQADQIDTLHAIFRAAHTLKALAGTVGHRPMAELTHAVEALFDDLRESRLSPDPALVDELLATLDVLKTLRDEIITNQPSGLAIDAYLARLLAFQAGPGAAEPGSFARRPLSPDQLLQAYDWQEQGYSLMEVEIDARPDAFAQAARLYQAGLAVQAVGQIIAEQPAVDSLTETDLQLWLVVATPAGPDTLQAVLADVVDLAGYRVRPYPLPDQAGPAARQAAEGPAEHGPEKTVRISIDRLDNLLNLVGELVTYRTRLLQLEGLLQAEYGKQGSVSALSDLAPSFNHVINQLQEEVMRARMLPIATLFNKFPRLVRQVARAGGKQANLEIAGEATELDRAVIEAITDPLMHLVRNAVDHGLERPQERLAAGKPLAGTVRLAAAALEGQIVLTISDDGRGIDPAGVRRAAVERRLLPAGEVGQLSDDEAIELIFRPNLSTASQVTEVSGRGVGLDVVRTNIERLSGSVTVTSQPGQGATFHLTLPLTLALVQAMLVTVRGLLYAIPVTSIHGSLYLAEAAISPIKGQPSLDWQGVVTPLLDLRQFFQHPRLNGAAAASKPAIVLVTWGKLRVGLVVDKIIGEQEIVVKTLSPLLGRPPGLSGATILGDGRIALIVDIPGLINNVLQSRRQGGL